MISWIKKLFCKKEQIFKGAAESMYYIEKYKDFDKIIKTYYQVKDVNGRFINVDGIVNPLKIDNRQQCSVTDNQGQTPHCAAYSICNLCEALIWKKTGKLVNLNADQVYARAKQIDGDMGTDGTYLEAAIRAAFELGGFNGVDIKIKSVYNDGTDRTIELIKFLIHKYDFLHVGFQITEGWYSANQRDYIIKDRGISLGGHAVLVCGYTPEGIIIQNSWGIGWGSKGFAILPWTTFKRQFIYACYLENSFDGI